MKRGRLEKGQCVFVYIHTRENGEKMEIKERREDGVKRQSEPL